MATNNAINSSNPIQVAKGGSGRSSTTAYAVICGGTTSTSAEQSIASVGTSGQVLTSNGAAALPTFQTVSAGFTSVVYQVFSASGTYTPTSGMKYCIVECIGGGGGGGGIAVTSTTICAAAGGGGGGAYSRNIFSSATIGSSQTVTIGAGGTAGSTAPGAGGSGGTTTLGALATAAGGGGGVPSTGAAGGFSLGVAGGVGGASGAGSVSLAGQPGGPGFCHQVTNIPSFFSGSGGASPLGGGSPTGRATNTGGAGQAGAKGSGGSGAGATNSAAQTGGTGGDGYMIITEFI